MSARLCRGALEAASWAACWEARVFDPHAWQWRPGSGASAALCVPALPLPALCSPPPPPTHPPHTHPPDLDWGDFFFNLISMCIVYAYFSEAAVAGESQAAIVVSMCIAAIDIVLLALRWLW